MNLNKQYKTGRVLDEYDLEEFHSRLPDLWLGTDGEAHSLRELADKINIAILRRAKERVGAQPLDGEVENVYRLLTEDDVSAGVRSQQRNRLKREGINVDRLEQNFVTHQAVHTYLTQVLEVSKDQREETNPLEKHTQRIQRLQSRTEAVTDNSIEELKDKDILSLGDYNTTLQIQVFCRECGSQYDIASLFDNGGCECPASG
jgi:hypothetical protein